MDACLKDQSGQLPGKTIIFAMTKEHAQRIRDEFEEMYPQHVGLAQVITSSTERVRDGSYGDGLITKFKKNNLPRIAISVDMLDTGIDVPEVVNLVFMKPVQSRIKLWQMIGRGTRNHAACKFFDAVGRPTIQQQGLHGELLMSQKLEPDRRLLLQICLRNFLSFGLDTPPLDLANLNVLIGPNGCGKSNLIEALALFRSAPVPPETISDADMRGVLRRGGGTQEWIWKGDPEQAASLELLVANPKGSQPLWHLLSFRGDEQGFRFRDEKIENEQGYEGQSEAFYYRFQDGHPVVNTAQQKRRKLARETVNMELSILAQRRDPELYPEITYLADTYQKFRIYRDWAFGRNTVFREPQKADMRNDRLEEDFSNLGLFLSRLRKTPKAKQSLLEGLKDLYDGITDCETLVEGGSVQVFFTEGDFSIPATRLSDGTLRYLCLLAILCDPTPPPLICIEEPELGLHPDILPKLADLLVAASERTQIVVTTHSDILVDAMTERPEVVVVCEKHDGQTQMNRLEKKDLAVWLDKYRLGQLWTKGKLGGTRW